MPRSVSRGGLRNESCTNSWDFMSETRANKMQNLRNFSESPVTEGGMNNHTYTDADTEPDNTRVEMGESMEGGMTLELKAYQEEDMEIALPPLQVRCTQANNDESLSIPLHETEETLEPGLNVEDESSEYDVVHIEPARSEGKYQERIEGKYTDKGMLCNFCNKLFGNSYYIKYHWCFSCPELALRDRNKYITRFKLKRKCSTQPSPGKETAKGKEVKERWMK